MKKLPDGIQSFPKLRNGDYLYVDKTEHIFGMIKYEKPFFLSRPRRFGKSLLLSTIEEIFEGNKSLFEGLYIYNKWDWEQKFPVIRLDFGGIANNSPEILQESLTNAVNRNAKKYGIKLNYSFLSDKFSELIEKMHESTGKKVVILIDEYDKPITDRIDTPEIMAGNKKILHDFYQILKVCDKHIRFIFMTGVSKFAGLTIFSGLNNLNDITLDEKFASICGYTQEELEHYFTEYLDVFAAKYNMSKEELLDAIRHWYNGFSWDGKTMVYNPYSTLLFFDKLEFSNYWFSSGTPTFLIEILKKRNNLKPILEPITSDSSIFNSFDPFSISEIALLFQTGYLTVKNKEFTNFQYLYTLDIPNNEVKDSLLKYLLNAYSYYPEWQEYELKQLMQKQLQDGDATGLEKSLREMIAYIPYPLHIENEAYYHSIMLLWLKIQGFDITGEITTNVGSIDAVLKFPGHTIVAEVKCRSKKGRIATLLTNAMKQIEEKRYYERFMNDKKVSLLSIVFAEKEIGCRIVEKK